jgi:hypothetical protein
MRVFIKSLYKLHEIRARGLAEAARDPDPLTVAY